MERFRHILSLSKASDRNTPLVEVDFMGLRIFFSYETPIAIKYHGQAFYLDYPSNTTQRHLRELGSDNPKERLRDEEFELRLLEAFNTFARQLPKEIRPALGKARKVVTELHKKDLQLARDAEKRKKKEAQERFKAKRVAQKEIRKKFRTNQKALKAVVEALPKEMQPVATTLLNTGDPDETFLTHPHITFKRITTLWEELKRHV